MNSFKFKGTSFCIHFSFLLFNALIFLFRDSSIILGFYAVCAVHELGHLIALTITGIRIRAVEFSGFGIMISTERNAAAPLKKSLFVLLAGPAANIILFILMTLMECKGPLPVLNLAAGLYNLLPYRQLDGGAAIELFTSGSVNEIAADRILMAIKLCITAGLSVIAYTYGVKALPSVIVSVILLVNDNYTQRYSKSNTDRS